MVLLHWFWAELIHAPAKEAARRGMMPKAPSSHGLVPAPVSSIFCSFSFHSHHPVDRAIVESGGAQHYCVLCSLFVKEAG